MADLGGLLGSMIATQMGGRGNTRSSRSASSQSGYSAGQAATIAGLGYLAWKAFQQWQQSGPAGSPQPGGTNPAPAPASSGGGFGGALGDSIGKILRAPSPPPPPVEPMQDAKALLLIRAMVAAANADGQISDDERQRISSALSQAGAGDEERAILEREMSQPLSIDQLLKDVTDQTSREQVYLASFVAVDATKRPERAYLDYLASRLGLDAEQTKALEGSL
ncbi:Uncharacterized membrane protein YebE, DUF533 family [Arboricoccus pini]|uniref:Uncharacterized membrane protein YebE, DUF533 family n=1 Tax=Arboricoccus pini TaxID=1963835 RepID=A0A212QS44_9PROT|nr:DUF533 domain-containing protein [Arboricoccus pini]SNB62408.1 Uncharacterized membrane protein YebE, DUF533 family [Arboricoccus pini]